MLLAIDTSSRYGGVALADASGVVTESRTWHTRMNHTAQLMPAVSGILQNHGLAVADLTGCAVALGPGPFSALRVGVSAAKGLAMAANLPIIGVDTLALEAARHLQPGRITIAWLDAGRREVAAAQFNANGQRTQDDDIATPESLLAQDANAPAPRLYCGEAAHARKDDILNHKPGADSRITVAPWTPADRLWELAAAGLRKLQSPDAASELPTLQPYYLRMPTIGAPKQRDRALP